MSYFETQLAEFIQINEILNNILHKHNEWYGMVMNDTLTFIFNLHLKNIFTLKKYSPFPHQNHVIVLL